MPQSPPRPNDFVFAAPAPPSRAPELLPPDFEVLEAGSADEGLVDNIGRDEQDEELFHPSSLPPEWSTTLLRTPPREFNGDPWGPTAVPEGAEARSPMWWFRRWWTDKMTELMKRQECQPSLVPQGPERKKHQGSSQTGEASVTRSSSHGFSGKKCKQPHQEAQARFFGVRVDQDKSPLTGIAWLLRLRPCLSCGVSCSRPRCSFPPHQRGCFFPRFDFPLEMKRKDKKKHFPLGMISRSGQRDTSKKRGRNR